MICRRFAVLAAPLLFGLTCMSSSTRSDDSPANKAAARAPQAQGSIENVVLADDFQKDSRALYQIRGPVTWEKGQLTMPPRGSFVRTTQAGPRAELSVGLEFPALNRPGEEVETEIFLFNRSSDAVCLILRGKEQKGKETCEIDLLEGTFNREKDRFEQRLLRRFFPKAVLKSGDWTLCFTYGLIRVEQSGKELAIGYMENPLGLWQTEAVMCIQRKGTIRCRSIRLKAPPPMTPEQMKRLKEVLPIFQQSGGLAEDFRTGKLDVNRYRKTMEEREKVVTTFEAAFGENHPGVVSMLLLQASGYSALRDQREISYVDRALATARKVYGDDHPATADVVVEAANVRQRVNDHGRARALLERALTIYRPVLGDESRKVASVFLKLAELDESEGGFAAADRYYEKAVTIYEKVYGKEALETGVLQAKVASTIAEREAIELAELKKYYGTAIDYYKKAQIAYGKHARELNDQLKKITDPDRELSHVRLLRRQVSEHESRMADFDYHLGSLYRHLGAKDEARRLQEEGLKLREKLYGKDDPRVALSLLEIGYAAHDQRHFSEAREAYQRVLKTCERTLGDALVLASIFEDIGATFRAEGNYPGTREFFEKAFQLKLKITADALPVISEVEGLQQTLSTYHLLFVQGQADRGCGVCGAGVQGTTGREGAAPAAWAASLPSPADTIGLRPGLRPRQRARLGIPLAPDAAE